MAERAVPDLMAALIRSVQAARMDRKEPTRDQSYCDIWRHQQCSGYTEDEFDAETCMCDCHNPPTPPTATSDPAGTSEQEKADG